MKIFYLNCHRLLKINKCGQRDWLVKFVLEENVDVVCLSESSNYDIGNDLPDEFRQEYRWKAADTTLKRMGYRFNIVSRLPVGYESIDYEVDSAWHGDRDPVSAADCGIGTMVSMRFESGIEIVPVHIQYKKSKSQTLSAGTAYYIYGLKTLHKYMLERAPALVFGDFNNYPDDEDFLLLSAATDYKRIEADCGGYTYKRNPEDKDGMIIDHAFTISDNISMSYIDSIEKGFDHKGMLITIG